VARRANYIAGICFAAKPKLNVIINVLLVETTTTSSYFLEACGKMYYMGRGVNSLIKGGHVILDISFVEPS